MKLDEGLRLRLQFLCRVVKKEAHYLQETDARLFADALSAKSLEAITQILCWLKGLTRSSAGLEDCRTP